MPEISATRSNKARISAVMMEHRESPDSTFKKFVQPRTIVSQMNMPPTANNDSRDRLLPLTTKS